MTNRPDFSVRPPREDRPMTEQPSAAVNSEMDPADIAVLNAAFAAVQQDHPGLTVAAFDAAIANIWHPGIALDDLVGGAHRHLV